MDTKNSPNTKEKLFAEFPPVATEAWEAVIADDLKGADYAKKLIWKTDEGLTIRPYYRAEDLTAIDTMNSRPGEFPFIRGKKSSDNNWFIRQDITVTPGGIREANQKAVDLLTKGVNSFGFVIAPGHDLTYDHFKTLLANIPLSTTEINFVAEQHSIAIARYIQQLISERNSGNREFNGSIGFSPLAYLTLHGVFGETCTDDGHAFDLCHDLVRAAAPFVNLKAIEIDGLSLTNAGATAVQELAFSLSQGVEYLHQLTERGLKAEEVAPKLRFNFGAGPNYFMEIAKIRAARLLWAQIVKSFGVETDDACRMNIHTTTISWNSTLYDPYVNLLRTTTESMSAVIAGTDSHTILPFDAAFGETTDFSERIARNQQLVLKEESNFDKLVDPAAGSYYVESITASIAAETLKLFKQTETEGGYFCAFRKGFIQDQIEASAHKRDLALATRRDILLGTNQYPNFTEKMSREPVTTAPETGNNINPKAIAIPITPYRGAMAFEAMRYRTDKFAAANHRPKAFMLTIGNFGMRKARAQFACNFFACAGFEVIDNNGFKTPAEGVEAAMNARADITVICSSDDEYTLLAPQINEMIAGRSVVVIAGNPPSAEELRSKGIKHFIHVKSNLLETLTAFQSEAGII